MILQDMSPALPLPVPSLSRARKLVASVLLEHAGDSQTERRWLSRRDIAKLAGAEWIEVHCSLASLQEAGAIRMEGHRLIINKELLSRAAAA